MYLQKTRVEPKVCKRSSNLIAAEFRVTEVSTYIGPHIFFCQNCVRVEMFTELLKFLVLTAASMKVNVLKTVVPCSLTESEPTFQRCLLHSSSLPDNICSKKYLKRQKTSTTTSRNILEASQSPSINNTLSNITVQCSSFLLHIQFRIQISCRRPGIFSVIFFNAHGMGRDST